MEQHGDSRSNLMNLQTTYFQKNAKKKLEKEKSFQWMVLVMLHIHL
jgi:hypothetical protein